MDIKSIINSNQGSIIDVRTTREFNSGHLAGALNIPVYDLDDKIEELKTLPQPIVVVCASGARSAHATEILNSSGIQCFDGGSWLHIENLKKEINL